MKMQRGSPRCEEGQTLLEILVALGASVFILSSIAIIVITSLSGTQFTKNQNLANQYAQEGIEVVRRIRDSGGWLVFSALGGTYCLAGGSVTMSPGSCTTPNIGSLFVRQVDVVRNSGECPAPVSNGSKVTSTVSWSDGKCATGSYCHKVQLATCLHNINIKPTP